MRHCEVLPISPCCVHGSFFTSAFRARIFSPRRKIGHCTTPAPFHAGAQKVPYNNKRSSILINSSRGSHFFVDTNRYSNSSPPLEKLIQTLTVTQGKSSMHDTSPVSYSLGHHLHNLLRIPSLRSSSHRTLFFDSFGTLRRLLDFLSSQISYCTLYSILL